jgi:hypothetical protein
MTYLLDVNILMAVAWPNHVHHQPARKWFNQVKSFATCPLVELGFLRVSANTTLQYSCTLEDAREALKRFNAIPGHHFWRDELPALQASIPAAQTHGQLTDNYLVGLAKNFGGELATFDEALKQRLGLSAPVKLLTS